MACLTTAALRFTVERRPVGGARAASSFDAARAEAALGHRQDQDGLRFHTLIVQLSQRRRPA